MGNPFGVAGALLTQGAIALARHALGEARACFEEGLAFYRTLATKHQGLGRAILGLGQVAAAQHEPVRAAALYGESLILAQEVGDKEGICMVFCCLAGLALLDALPIGQKAPAAPGGLAWIIHE